MTFLQLAAFKVALFFSFPVDKALIKLSVS